MRWSIDTPHQVQGPTNRYTPKMEAPDAGYVALDALHRAYGDLITANCTLSDRAPDATSERPLTPSGVRVNLTPSLSLGPDATR